MSEYKGIKGFQVQTRTEDPAPFAQALADNPYAGAWGSGGDMNSAKRLQGAAGSSSTAGLVFGGRLIPGTNVAETESYNGTSFTEVADLSRTNERAYVAGAGTQTAALAIGGAPPGTLGLTESWNGSSWTEVADLNRGPAGPQSTAYGAGSGSYTSALYSSSDEGGNLNDRVESWDGSSWTEVAEVNTARSYGTQSGTANTSAIFAGGYSTTTVGNVETWNGSSWTETTDLNTARMRLSSSMQGSTTSTIVFSGMPPTSSLAVTESWDGSSWTEVNDLATARRSGAGSGTATNSFFTGGQTGPSSPSVVASTEEWTFSGVQPTDVANYVNAITGDFYYNSSTGQFKTVNTGGAPIGSWSSGNNLNTARYGAGSGGTTSTAIVGGGSAAPGYVTASESYDGSSWSEVSEINTARGFLGSGTQTPATGALIFGGYTGTADSATTEYWNGSSWAEQSDLNTARRYLAGAASVYTAALAMTGKQPGGAKTEVESFDGSSWTEVADVNTAVLEGATGTGTNTAALKIGGRGSAGAWYPQVEQWDGSSWTEIAELNTTKAYSATTGSVTDSLVGLGLIPPSNTSATTEHWNGSSWTEVADAATARYGMATGTGTGGTNLLASGGYTTTNLANTEEWTATDFEIKSVTTS